MTKKSKCVIIIGGGVIGGFAAYYLLEKGWSVTVVDKDRFGQGASSGNCGLIVPNHILPLNSMNTLTKALKWMLSKDSPLYIKPRLDAGLIKWFYRFACHARPKAVLKSAMGRHALLQSSFELYPTFMEAEKVACDWDMGGSLHLYRSAKGWNGYRETDAFLKRFGIQAQPLDREAVRRLVPALGDRLSGGWLYRQTAHLRPERLMSELRRILLGRGARILENCPVQTFRQENGRAVAIVTKDTEHPADAFVLATGAWAPAFEKILGCKLPIQPGKGYSITMNRPQTFPKIPCFFEEQSIVSTPWPDTCRLGGTMEFSGFDTHLNQRRLWALTSGFNGYSDQWLSNDKKEEWCGFRPMTMDGLPFIDYSPRLRNVMIAAGHNMIGLSAAPGTGKLVADIMEEASPHIDPRPYRITRHDTSRPKKGSRLHSL
jgi:D-amino-acid dehydrogenase